MLFKKTGTNIKATIKALIQAEREAYKQASERFDKERSKTDLQDMNEIEIRIARLERIVKHTVDDEIYQLTEQDLIDFGY